MFTVANTCSSLFHQEGSMTTTSSTRRSSLLFSSFPLFLFVVDLSPIYRKPRLNARNDRFVRTRFLLRQTEDQRKTRFFFPKKFFSFRQPEREQIMRISSNKYLVFRRSKSVNNTSSRTIRRELANLQTTSDDILVNDVSRQGLIFSSVLA